jgi:hypothetical protein
LLRRLREDRRPQGDGTHKGEDVRECAPHGIPPG